LDNPAVPEQEDANNEPEVEVTTRTGQTIKSPKRLIKEISAMTADGAMTAEGATAAANYENTLTVTEVHYYATMKTLGKHPREFGCVGAGLGGGFLHTQELHVMKCKQAMQSKDKEKWKVSKKNMEECKGIKCGKQCLARLFPKETKSLPQLGP
jgi:hypothetical protein